MTGPIELDLDVLGQPMSVLVAEARSPRAVVLALHGGNSSKEYFDAPLDPSLSLLRLGSQLGFTVVAPDRPGYGAGAEAQATMSPEDRTELLYATLDAVLADRDPGQGTFVVAHSLGCVAGVRLAAHARGADLLGLEISGTGSTLQSPARDVMSAPAGGERNGWRQALRELIWGPESLYPPGTQRAARILPMPASDGADVAGWLEEMPAVAARVRVPVRYSLTEHEGWWLSGQPGLDSVAPLFSAAPLVETAVEQDAGHNVSLGRTARAYHLRVLAFAEHCLALRGRSGQAASSELRGTGSPSYR